MGEKRRREAHSAAHRGCAIQEPCREIGHEEHQLRLVDFDVLTFDMIGTLIDFETGVLQFARPRILRVAPTATDTEILECYARAQSSVRASEPALLFSARLPKIWAEMARSYDVPVRPEDGVIFIRSAREWPAFPDSAEALTELQKFFRFLVVVTNGDRVSARTMAATLGAPFSEIITEEDMGFAKPDPRAFEYFMIHLDRQGVNRKRILHVAQSQYHDIGAARRAGLATAWIYRRHGQPGYGGTQPPPEFTTPDFLATSLEDLVRQYRAELFV
jgi:2-haloalkanoic acid dehalogenase type II